MNLPTELEQARKDEMSWRLQLRAASENTNCGAPLWKEDRVRGAWVNAYCKVRELEGTTGYE